MNEETWYLAGWGKIEPVKVVKSTEKTVTVSDRYGLSTRHKETNSDHYFSTWEEGHAYLLGRAERKLDSVRRQLQLAQSEHGNVKGMKKP